MRNRVGECALLEDDRVVGRQYPHQRRPSARFQHSRCDRNESPRSSIAPFKSRRQTRPRPAALGLPAVGRSRPRNPTGAFFRGGLGQALGGSPKPFLGLPAGEGGCCGFYRGLGLGCTPRSLVYLWSLPFRLGLNSDKVIEIIGAPYGNRTRVSAVKGRRPGPLDEGRGPRANGAVGSARRIKRFGFERNRSDGALMF